MGASQLSKHPLGINLHYLNSWGMTSYIYIHMYKQLQLHLYFLRKEMLYLIAFVEM